MSKAREWHSETARRVCLATGKDNPIEGAIILAEDLTQQCDLARPAFALDKVASWQGAKIEEVEMADAGRLIQLFGADFDFLIQINQAHARAKKNFSTGHEIGHTLMPDFAEEPSERLDADTMTWNEEKEEEYLCDVVAAEILMPRREFVPRLHEAGLHIESLPLLAEEFGSSLEATALGMTKTNVDDFTFIIWELGWNKAQKEETLNPSLFEEWGLPPQLYRTQMVASCGRMLDFHFPHNKSIEMDSLIATAIDSDGIVRGVQELNIGGGKTREFYTESKAFPLWRSGNVEQRIFTMVHLKQT